MEAVVVGVKGKAVEVMGEAEKVAEETVGAEKVMVEVEKGVEVVVVVEREVKEKAGAAAGVEMVVEKAVAEAERQLVLVVVKGLALEGKEVEEEAMKEQKENI